ncbi:G1/S-specific cyclin-D1 [Clonorchis sinensis]|uniref:G1/S-specific cyclin-D1 n=1 Tax=Clonorchis sinensis TaxID=79923 RepID=G7YVG0_CLOSI|nr:G1/S-specific cyclin-D1 [Clonorchis sinensis]
MLLNAGFCVFAASKDWWPRNHNPICAYRRTDAGVLSQTAQLIDRYLHVVPIEKSQYQLVGAACFFISSKLKESTQVPLSEMVKFTDYSVQNVDILAYEMMVCLSLAWDLTCITPVDFIAPVVDFLEFVPELKQIIRQAALNIYTKVFHVEDLGLYMPSYMAAACILYALNLTVHPDLGDVTLRSVTRIQQLLRLEALFEWENLKEEDKGHQMIGYIEISVEYYKGAWCSTFSCLKTSQTGDSAGFQRKIREVYQHLQSCFKPGTIELSEAVIKADSGVVTPSPEPPVPPSPHQYVGLTSNSVVPMPMATSTVLPTRPVCGDASSHSNSLSSFGSSSGSFENASAHLPSASISTCSPSETEFLNETENEQPPISELCVPRPSVPHVQYYHYPQAAQHPNAYAAGQILNNECILATANGWENAAVSLTGPLSKMSDYVTVKAAVFPGDPRFVILTAAGLPVATQRRWTPTDIRDVQLE